MSIAVLSATVTRARSALLDKSSSGIARPVAMAGVNLTNVKLFLEPALLCDPGSAQPFLADLQI